MLTGEAAHRLDEMRREALALAAAVDHGDHRGEDVGLRPSTLPEPRLEHVVDSARQALCDTRGEGARMADDGVALLVPEHELQLGQLGAQEVPVAQRHLAVAHERRHRVLDLARPRSEVGAFGVGEGVDRGAAQGADVPSRP